MQRKLSHKVYDANRGLSLKGDNMRKIAILLAISLLYSTAWAQSKGNGMNPERSAYVGGLVGLAFPTGGSDLTFGGDFGYKLNQFMGVGLYVSYLGQSVSAANQTFTASQTVVAAEGSYHFADAMDGLRIGAKLGMDFLSQPVITVSGSTATSTNDTTTELAFGPHIGYDYSMGGGLSLGGEFNLIFVTKSGADALPNLLGTIKYWF
jgi:hypothetical protein